MKNKIYYLAYKIHMGFFHKMIFNIGIYIIIQILLKGAYYKDANTEGFSLPPEFWTSVYENEKGEQGKLRVSEDGTAIMFKTFATIHDEMNQKNTDPNSLVESASTPTENPQKSSTPLLPTVDEASLFCDILKTYGAIAADRNIETKINLAKTCIGWVVHKMPPNFWSAMPDDTFVSMEFFNKYIDSIPATVSEAQKQGVSLFQAAIVAYTWASSKNLTHNAPALYTVFNKTISTHVNLDDLGYL